MAWTNPETFTAGQTLTAASMNKISENVTALSGSRLLGSRTRTTNYTSDQTTLSMANMFDTGITWTADGTSTYWVEFYCPRLVLPNTGGAYVTLCLVDGSGNGLGAAALILSGSATGNQMPVYARVPYTPASGSRTINFRAPYGTAANAVWYGGSGGATTSDLLPMWMAVYGPQVTT